MKSIEVHVCKVVLCKNGRNHAWDTLFDMECLHYSIYVLYYDTELVTNWKQHYNNIEDALCAEYTRFKWELAHAVTQTCNVVQPHSIPIPNTNSYQSMYIDHTV